VREAMPCEIAGAHAVGHDGEPAGPAARTWAEAAPLPLLDPRSPRITLPGRLALRCGAAAAVEAQEACLLAIVRVDTQRLIVLPGDAQARRHSHDVAYAEGLALQAGASIRLRVPGHGDLRRLCVQRQ